MVDDVRIDAAAVRRVAVTAPSRREHVAHGRQKVHGVAEDELFINGVVFPYLVLAPGEYARSKFDKLEVVSGLRERRSPDARHAHDVRERAADENRASVSGCRRVEVNLAPLVTQALHGAAGRGQSPDLRLRDGGQGPRLGTPYVTLFVGFADVADELHELPHAERLDVHRVDFDSRPAPLTPGEALRRDAPP